MIYSAEQMLPQPWREEEGSMVILHEEALEEMIKFAQLHVKAALEAAVNKGDVYQTDEGYIRRTDENSILNSYPLTNIK